MGKKSVIRKIPSLTVMLAISILSALPTDKPIVDFFEFSDKLNHFAAYFVLCLTFCLWHSKERWLAKPVFCGVSVILGCAIFGIFNEFYQAFVPQREGNDFGDMLANIVGSFFAAFLYFAVLRFRKGASG